jgi:hypothetical protein
MRKAGKGVVHELSYATAVALRVVMMDAMSAVLSLVIS